MHPGNTDKDATNKLIFIRLREQNYAGLIWLPKLYHGPHTVSHQEAKPFLLHLPTQDKSQAFYYLYSFHL